ncbi:MAG: plastocyanin/azurin family copper-binding protein [Actinomycetota bacterium]|nr:plastocyanin/azurin family copper-binding protein [Actinomycetota bacterium]
MHKKTKLRLLAAAVGVLLVLGSPAWAQKASVSAIDNEFDPAQIDVQAGTTVTWTNDGEAPHTVTASDGSFDSGNLDPGQSYSVTFEEAGDFSYICEYHEGDGMVGAVTVAAAGNGGGNGNGNGDGGNGGGDPTEPAEDDTTDDDTLPQTGPDGLGAFLYLALVLIAAGASFIRLGRHAYRP